MFLQRVPPQAAAHSGDFSRFLLWRILSAADWPSCPEFGKLGGIACFVVQPPVAPRALNTQGTISAFRRLAVGEEIVVVQR
ncbi:MAG: hypothetical protein DME39_08420 [Verrucomicrobia bacterium]|nr:MAG: hypothetical protein DME39_08420 [Verrucomicrobiota bacterium]